MTMRQRLGSGGHLGRRAGSAAATVTLALLAGCSGGSSPAAAPSTPAAATTSPSPSASLAPGSARPPITAAAARRLMARYAERNNRANHALSLAALRRVDAGATIVEDRGYIRAGRFSGQRPPPFWTVPQQIAVTASGPALGAGLARPGTYFVATTLSSAHRPAGGQARGRTSPGIDVFVRTAAGWRHGASVGVGGANATGAAALPQLAPASAAGVVAAAGSSAVAARASQLVTAAVTACASGHPAASVTGPRSCGELDALRQVATFHVTATPLAVRLPSYSVALTGGRTLVVGSREVKIRVRAPAGVQWTGPTLVSGLLHVTGNPPRLAHGFVERSMFTVALDVPADAPATTLGVASAPVAAHRVVPPGSLTQV